jgi:ABC-type polysaccharide/polyol phosphate transport system ATPase subunit
MNDVAIKVNNVTKVYHLFDKPSDRIKELFHPLKKSYHHDFYALKNVSFEVKKGETIGIIGKNGAGKSTILKVITGVITPTEGSVEVNGRIASLLELGTGFNPELTGIENIYFNGTFMGFSREEMDKKIDAILAFADIGEYIYQPVKMYSSGMFARLAFSVAINVDPEILIVDEALSVGDAKFQLKCTKKMQAIQKAGTTILYVSHDTYSVRTLCSYAVWLKDGEVEEQGLATHVINQYMSYLDSGNANAESSNGYDLTHPDVNIKLLSENRISINCLSNISVKFCVENTSSETMEITYVFNLYTLRDGTYLCGATTLMDMKKTDFIKAYESKEIELDFKSINLLSGVYKLRLAVNDMTGIGIYCELNEAVIITISDNHEAEGMMTIDREWKIINEDTKL